MMHFQRQHSGSLAEAYQVFFEAVKTDNIDAVVLAAWEFFGLPVLLIDENYKALVQFPKRKLGEPMWDTMLENRAVPLEVIQRYNQAFSSMNAPFYDPFYSKEGPAADCPRIFGEIHSEDQIYGHVTIFLFDSPLLPEDLAATQVFVDALKILLMPRQNRRGAALYSYLRELLGDKSSPAVRALALRSLSDSVPGPFRVMVTPLEKTAFQQALAPMPISRITSQYSATVSTLFDSSIVTLFGTPSEGEDTPRDRDFYLTAAQRFTDAHIPSGISPSFEDLTQLKGRVQQAHMAALLAQGSCVFFEDVFPATLFQMVCNTTEGSLFFHPALTQLLDYDAQNQTEYFRTLQVYSLTLHNKESASRILCVHRNTLLYRLGKISQLFHIPFEEQETALALLNSFQLYGVGILGRVDFGLAAPSQPVLPEKSAPKNLQQEG